MKILNCYENFISKNFTYEMLKYEISHMKCSNMEIVI